MKRGGASTPKTFPLGEQQGGIDCIGQPFQKNEKKVYLWKSHRMKKHRVKAKLMGKPFFGNKHCMEKPQYG